MWSILLIPIIIFLTPKVNANKACSFVYPYSLIPASNSPGAAEIINTATSAYDVPVIMFLMKSLWPGASMIEQKYFAVSNLLTVMLIVIPLSRSALSVSKIQAYLNEPFPKSSASFSYFSNVL